MSIIGRVHLGQAGYSKGMYNKSQNNQFPYIVTSLKWMKWLVSIIQTGFRVETLAGLLLASSMNSLILYLCYSGHVNPVPLTDDATEWLEKQGCKVGECNSVNVRKELSFKWLSANCNHDDKLKLHSASIGSLPYLCTKNETWAPLHVAMLTVRDTYNI